MPWTTFVHAMDEPSPWHGHAWLHGMYVIGTCHGLLSSMPSTTFQLLQQSTKLIVLSQTAPRTHGTPPQHPLTLRLPETEQTSSSLSGTALPVVTSSESVDMVNLAAAELGPTTRSSRGTLAPLLVKHVLEEITTRRYCHELIIINHHNHLESAAESGDQPADRLDSSAAREYRYSVITSLYTSIQT